ncbi:histidine kinase N-terminal 7TM domain-containing diguanylate cyclase, partial [Kineococcus arenarius]|uniref:histidine kinase N-terminal 7TM domain-containing diguanylate cyclase n=1 Tax=Kineococcus sp. SYSU DK007 TaxID=3383128 RepID=UPI003D7EE109
MAAVPDVLGTLFVLSALVCAVTAALAWRHRRSTPAATALTVTMSSTTVWSLAILPGLWGADPAVQSVAGLVCLAAVHAVCGGAYTLYRSVVDPSWRVPRRQVLLLATACGACVLTAALNPGELFFTDLHVAGDPPRLTGGLGPLFWVHTTWSYSVASCGLVLLVRAWPRAPRAFRTQIACLLTAACVPAAGNALVLLTPHRLGQGTAPVDLTPLFFLVAGLVDAAAILRCGLLQVVPVARAQVLETLADAVVVVDGGGRVVDVNPAGRDLVRRVHPHLPAELVGLPALDVLGHDVHGAVTGDLRRTVELLPGLHVDVRVTPLTDGRGRSLGHVVAAHDVSDAVRSAQRLREQLGVIERLRAELQEESLRDPLTGLHNRRHLDTALVTALAHADTHGLPLSVLLLDVDRFKSVNDEHGHGSGDELLRALAGVLGREVRSGDTVARYGGEEFVVLLPGADRVGALRRAEQLRAACARVSVPLPVPTGARGDDAGGTPERLHRSVSVGVATYPADGTDAASLLAAADHALYAAKAAGRDQVVAA